MKVSEFDKVVKNTPFFRPAFEVTKVPGWAKEYVNVGDVVYYSFTGSFTTESGMHLGLSPSYLKFLEYRKR